MLDPATAIAVAGLAFDVAKDLLKLFKAWKSCPEDAIELRAAILWLSETFGLIDKKLQGLQGRENLKAGQEEEYNAVISGTLKCRLRVEALRVEVNKVQVEKREKAYEKIQNELKRFRYCFSKDRIEKMLGNVNECEKHLHVTLTILNIGTTVKVLDEVTSFVEVFGTSGKARDEKLKEEFESLRQLIRVQAAQSDLRQQLAIVLKDDKHTQALTWLMPLERQQASSSFHSSLYHRREFGTGSWFIGGDVFQKWQEDQNTCLWLQGQVGCGKSVLWQVPSTWFPALLRGSSSTIIHDLQQRCYLRADDGGGDILIYHYFSHKEGTNQHAEPMVRSCIAQAALRGAAKALIVDLYDEYHVNFMDVVPSVGEFTTFFFKVLKALSNLDHAKPAGHPAAGKRWQREIFVVLDALDEIPFGRERDEVLTFVQALRNEKLPNMHLLLTSRAGNVERDIADMLDQAGEYLKREQTDIGDAAEIASIHSADILVEQLPLMKFVTPIEDIKADIELVVQKELRTHRRLKKLQHELKEHILNSLVRNKQPVFRKVALQLTALDKKEFSDSTTTRDIDQILGSPSADYDELYQQLLNSVNVDLRLMVHSALRWLLHARRPVSMAEFVEICSFADDDNGAIKFWEGRRKSLDELSSIFAGFVAFQSSVLAWDTSMEALVSLDHLSVREYLVGKDTINPYNMEPCNAHRLMAQCCVRYLMQNNSLEKKRKQYALRDYAWNYWTWHCVRTRPLDATSADVEDALSSAAARVYEPGHGNELYLASMLWALIGMQKETIETNLSVPLALPYFYEEFETESIPSLATWYHERLSYQHNTLENPGEQLRLINLLPTNDDSSELRAKIEVIAKIQEKSYEVVTYMWNPTTQPAILRIDGMPYDIPAGLAHVLRRLRSNITSARVLWIDAVSIDQQQKLEKSIMVSRMPEIFRRATSHAIFADTTAKEKDGQAIDLLKRIDQILAGSTQSEVQKRHDLVDVLSKCPAESLLRSLFDRRLWTRIWPLQEMVLSKDSTIFYGEHQISIKVLERVLLQHKMLEELIRTVPNPKSTTSDLSRDFAWQSIVELACTRAAVQNGNAVHLLRILYASRHLQCHNPLDRIYAIVGLLRAESPRPSSERAETHTARWRFRIDYEEDPTNVFVKAAIHILENSMNLDIFSFISRDVTSWEDPELVRVGRELPSWASTYKFDDRRETLPLITGSITYPVVPDIFGACGFRHEKIVRHTWPGNLRMRYLYLDGYSLDHIFQIYSKVDEATFTGAVQQRRSFFSNNEVVASCTKSLSPNETLFSAYWRTICANQVRIGKLLPSNEQCADQRLFPANAAEESLWDVQQEPLIALKFSENRRFFVTAKGRIGLAPATASEGDTVAVIPGGKVPYILRPRPRDRHPGGPAYTLIGDSYVHGIMNGEAMTLQASDLLERLTII